MSRGVRLVILCVEDEPDVREALLRDLGPFTSVARLEAAESVDDARASIAEIVEDGDSLALVLADHLLPGRSGVELLVELHGDPRTAPAKKVLVTGQAGLADTVTAVNEADLDRYVAKPWDPEDLQRIVRDQLTDYVVEHVDDVLPFVAALDGPRLLEAHGRRAADR